ncbi:hypothetical protein BGX34_003389 [Mortierella sp. NVP85]|nr:hypothetical protein BGX34_003389 [Mortierella sp. NVP85]
MPPAHPLGLAEILSLVVVHLPPNSLPVCARVSKAWYQACLPFFWEDFSLKDSEKSLALIQSHSHLVKKLRIGSVPQEHATLRFSNLDSIHLESPGIEDSHTIRFILEHPMVTRLELRSLLPACEPAFWDRLLGFHNLRDLAMPSVEIFGANVDKFWQLCKRLQRLDIYVLDPTIDTPIPEKLTSIREFSLLACYANNIPFFIEFIRNCPYLTSIEWLSNPSQDEGFVSGLVKLLETNSLPNLERLHIGTGGISNVLFAKLLQHMPRITSLSVDFSQNAFRMDFATLLQPHFSNLRILEVTPTVEAKSSLAQDIMSSCPLLETLKAPFVDAHVVAEGKPWVCLNLKVLKLVFFFDPPNSITQLQPLILDRLATLTRLEELSMVGPLRRNFFGGTIDLRIESGLDRLSTLGRLSTFRICQMDQRMEHAEVDWMLKHWKNLTVFDGLLNNNDMSLNDELAERLEKHGISCE